MFGTGKAISGHPHMGVAYLTALLKQRGYLVNIVDEGIEEDEGRLFEVVDEFSPDLIGVTAFSYCYHSVKEAVAKLDAYTDAPIMIGGPHVSAVRGETLQGISADFALKGEGELSFPAFLEELGKRAPDFSRIPGLIWRDGGKIVENEDSPFVQNLDILPFPDYEAFDITRYPCYAQKSLPIISSRGCPYRCSFCSVKLSMGHRFRARSPENVLTELEHWVSRGFSNFAINDDCFSFDVVRAKTICDLIVKRGLKLTYQLYNGIRADRVDQELLAKMKASGCVFISYGLESGNQEVLKAIHKGVTPEQVRQVVEWSNQVGIRTSVNFIIGHPGETFQQATDSLRIAESLPTDFVNFYNLVPYPGTEVIEWVKKSAHFLVPADSYLEDISYRDNSPVFETKEFTKEERERILRKGFALYEKTILRFRLGKALGKLVYILTRFRPLREWGRNFALYSRAGRKLYLALSSKSRQ